VRRPLLLPPGRYRVQAQVRAPFRRLFAIPDEQAQARLRVRVLPDADERRMGGPPLPPRDPHASAALAPVPTVGRPDAATLPDLVALPPWSAYAQRRGRRDELRFAGTPWNAGPAPLLVEGFRRPGEDVSDAFQYFTDAAGAVVGRARAGTMAYHSGGGHDHWHFRQLVDYRMLTRSGRTIVRARKQAFCLVPTNAVDLTRPGARLAPDVLGLDSSACGEAHSIWLRQTLPAGWGDTYPPDVEGQSFDITRVPNGRYLLEMEANPLGALREVSTANNVARRGVVLSGKRGKRRVRMLPWHGVRD
jgi:lysyl oxidase